MIDLNQIILECFRLLSLFTLLTLGPLALGSLSAALVQALIQVQDATSMQFLRIVIMGCTLFIVGDEITEGLLDLIQDLERQLVSNSAND